MTDNINEAPKGGPARPKLYSDTMVKATKFGSSNIAAMVRAEKARKAAQKKTNEEVEQIDEGPWGSRSRQSFHGMVRDLEWKRGQAEKEAGTTPKITHMNIMDKGKVVRRVPINQKTNEESEQIDELSRGSIEKYHDASWLQRRKLKRDHSSIYGTDPKVQKQIDKRERGLALAQKKMYKFVHKEEIDEAKMNAPQKDAVQQAINLRDKIGMKTPFSAAKKIIKFVKNEQVEHIEEANMDHSSFAKEYRENESNNKHSENVVLMAKHFGSEEDHEKAKDILRRHKRIGHLPQDLATERLKIVKKLWPKASQHMKSHANEEVDLEEGRGRPPKVGSKAWHAKQAAVKSGEGEEQEADKNIVNQMRKKPVGDHHTLVFNNGEKKQVHVQHVNKALSMLANTSKPADKEKLQNSFAHSHDRFMSTVKSGKPVEDAARPKVSLGKMKAEAVDPETATADRKPKRAFLRRGPDGVLRVHSRSGGPSSTDVVDAQEAFGYYDPSKSEEAEEKRESHKSSKGASADMTKDSSDRMQAMSPQAFKKKFMLPPTVGNTSAGGEDTTYAQGKYSVAEEEILNNLYANLSEENKEIFDNLIETEEGIDQLLSFAREQGL
jgi:hypothetical protein